MFVFVCLSLVQPSTMQRALDDPFFGGGGELRLGSSPPVRIEKKQKKESKIKRK